MVLEGADGAFGGVAALHLGWGELVVNIMCCQVLTEELTDFVVEKLELGLEATGE